MQEEENHGAGPGFKSVKPFHTGSIRGSPQKRDEDNFEGDLKLNYAPDIVMLTCSVIFRGHEDSANLTRF